MGRRKKVEAEVVEAQQTPEVAEVVAEEAKPKTLFEILAERAARIKELKLKAEEEKKARIRAMHEKMRAHHEEMRARRKAEREAAESTKE